MTHGINESPENTTSRLKKISPSSQGLDLSFSTIREEPDGSQNGLPL
jgi:hypothetical protein